MRFRDKTVLIFGGNSGIGRAAATGFAHEGARILITGRNSETLDGARATIGDACHAMQADITKLADTERVVRSARDWLGGVDVLFINAGIGTFVPLEEASESLFDHIMGTNLKGPYFALKEALPILNEGASVILTSSIAHIKPLAGNSIYAASKAGLRSLVQNIGAELVGRNIRVNCFSPGPIDTPIFDRSTPDPSAMRAAMREVVPMGRLGTVEEAAAAVLFLASTDSSFISGIDLVVDGGLANLA